MTIRAFFDKGIYKATLKRFSIGSIIYFIMLFLCTAMAILLAYEPQNAEEMMRWYVQNNYHGLILHEEFIFPSVIIAFFVPTVVALLCYRFVHSKKTSIFVHSLPVTRTVNYISTLMGAFTLMAIPVVANSAVLILLSKCGYGGYFKPLDVVMWALFNLAVLFIMFSISTFSAMCTGNSFALVAINTVLIFAPLVVASITETILLEFLYGYSYKRNLLDFAAEINPVYFLGEAADRICVGEIPLIKMWAFIAFSVVLYVAGYFIYKFRHVETSEDVAGFKVLNPILKYTITFIGTLAVFSIFTTFIAYKTALFTFLVILASVVLYFGSEMILKKTLKVWHSYKGYLAFGVAFTAFILFRGLTSVFGYETYVPEIAGVEQAAIYNYYYQEKEPFIKNEELCKYIIKVHSEFADDEYRSILNHDAFHDTRIHIAYKMKNGKTITRRYGISFTKLDEIMKEVYKYPEYKEACLEVFRNDIRDVVDVDINGQEIGKSIDEMGELLECIKKDMEKLEYPDIHMYKHEDCLASISMRYLADDDAISYVHINITEKYTNTIKWIIDAGYENLVDTNRIVRHGERSEDVLVRESDNTVIYVN